MEGGNVRSENRGGGYGIGHGNGVGCDILTKSVISGYTLLVLGGWLLVSNVQPPRFDELET